MGSGKRSRCVRRCVLTVRTAVKIALLLTICEAGSSAQSATQQRVYGAASASTATAILPAYNKDGTTGALSLLPGAPFADRLEGGLVAIDRQGRFLFVLNPTSDNVSMFQIDSSSGSLTEVPSSPFAVGPTVNPNLAPSKPLSLATEKSGGFLYVGYANGDSTTTSAVVPLAIDAANLKLVLTAQLSMDLGNGAPVQMLTDPKGLRLYVGLGPSGNQSSSSSGTLVYSIDGTSGVLTLSGNAGGGTDWGRAIAIDPQGKFFYDGWGQVEGFLDAGLISPVDGTSTVSSTVNLGVGVFPSVLLIEASGKFFYAQTGAGLLIYSIDGTSGALALVNGPLAAFSFKAGAVVADPMGPFLYSLGQLGVDAFQIDSTTGNLTEIRGAPFATGSATPAGGLGLAISGSGAQSISGPAAQIFPAAQDFGQVTVGQTSATKILSIVNIGAQTLAINGISMNGPAAGDFAKSSTCGATLAPNSNCSVSIQFTPSQTNVEQAALQVSDNAAGSPQSATLTGTGVAPQGYATLMPGSVNFATIAQGATATQQIQLTNSGTGALHVASITLNGSNPGDFSETNTCLSSALAVQASCTVNVTFAPQSQGQRTASLSIMDDGAASPQSVALSGSGAAPFQFAATGGVTAATVAAGQTAHYALQITPGPNFSGNVSFQCSGTPLAAVCSASPGSVVLANGQTATLQVAVSTTGSAFVPPKLFVLRQFPILPATICCVCLLFALLNGTRWSARRQFALVRLGCVAFLAGAVLFVVAGCGSGAMSDPPPRVVTPAGTTTLTVSAQSGTLPQQTIQLTLTVD